MSLSPFPSRTGGPRDPRNAKASTELELELFAGKVARGEVAPIDRLGVPVVAGAAVLCQFDQAPVMRVVSLEGVKDAGAPAGLVRLRLLLDVPIVCQVGRPVLQLVCLPHLTNTEPASHPPAQGDETPNTPTSDPSDAGPMPANREILPTE